MEGARGCSVCELRFDCRREFPFTRLTDEFCVLCQEWRRPQLRTRHDRGLSFVREFACMSLFNRLAVAWQSPRTGQGAVTAGGARQKRGPGRPTERRTQQPGRLLPDRDSGRPPAACRRRPVPPLCFRAIRSSSAFAQRVAAGVAPIDPAQMRAAYGVNQISFGGRPAPAQGQTIAIVDAYNDPDIISDANSFSSQFGLQQFNVSGGPTLQVLNEIGRNFAAEPTPARAAGTSRSRSTSSGPTRSLRRPISSCSRPTRTRIPTC